MKPASGSRITPTLQVTSFHSPSNVSTSAHITRHRPRGCSYRGPNASRGVAELEALSVDRPAES